MGGNIEMDLGELLAAADPANILAIGQRAGDVFRRYVAQHPACDLQQLDREDCIRNLGVVGRFDVIFVGGVLEHLTKQKAAELIARLRDMHTKRLYLLVPMGTMWLAHASHWEQNDLIAFGMELVNVYAENGWPFHLYKFDLHSYKGVPEWFNNRNWAHPELWDKC
jgi:hypothetical protein